ncbi:uncharacterized protein BCR38DRAFT_59088 [Pseudomassariella vexata]|uniref:SnoaL-like domain-containing protein n=1 Tax=Pseudomassariella vexata TaxID=1141098 RepID=A0A1Y2DK45_9PEZI|nr:uncharacterized protein BCR38DRAFT_59088 [Pseudomassariella vexata]ORY59549.1 hypothetical protein BCR38DRAFT_59088 [Pseudomassariella vexata]
MAKDLKTLPERYSTAWAEEDPKALLNLVSDDCLFTDHGAQIRVPRPFIEGHHRNWRGAHKDFEVYVDPAFPVYWIDVDEAKGNAKCSFRTVNKGVFVNDLPRRKATGMPFQYSGVVDLEVQNGLVTKADEWLRVPFEDSVSVEEYIVISDETRKKIMAERDAGK